MPQRTLFRTRGGGHILKEVVITIRSSQAYESDGDDSIEFSTDGLYQYSDGSCTLCYYESEITGMAGTRTTMTLSPEEIVVDREGTNTSKMVFKEGVKSEFLYNTPYGTATLSFDTRRIKSALDASGGTIDIDYVVSVEHSVMSRNRFTVEVKEIRMENIYNG